MHFQVMGALCKHSPSVGDQRQTPHPAPKSGGFGKPKTWGELLLTSVALLTCSLRPSMLSSGWDKGSSLGHRSLCSHARGWGSPQHLLGTNGIAPWAECYCWGWEKQKGGYLLSHLRGLGKGWTWTAGSDSTASPHSLVPREFLTSQYHPQHCLSHSQ